jgi:hypothetical protein
MIVLSLLACGGDTAILVTLRGQVSDFTTDSGIVDASIAFENASGAPIGDATTTAAGDWETTLVLPYNAEDGATVFGYVEHDGHVPTSVHHVLRFHDVNGAEGALHPGRRQSARILEVEPYMLAPDSDLDGTISGRVFDAVVANQAAGIGGLTLTIREGIDATDGSPVVATTKTEDFPSPGEYRVPGLPAGTYTVEIDGGGVWANARFTAISVGGDETPDQNGATSVALAPDQFRVVLSWDLDPPDVDSHLTGPGDVEADPTLLEGRFHVFYANAEYPAGAGTESAVVFLDVDDTSSYGPETVTVRRADPGLYKYVLHDYTNRSAGAGSTDLSASKSKVQLFAGAEQVETFYVPTGRAGTTWTVFELDGDTLRPYLVSRFGEAESPTDPLFY